MQRQKIGVIGTGPAGSAVIHHLTEAGHDVTVLDVGFEIEPHLAALTRAAAAVDRDHFLSQVAAQRRTVVAGKAALPPKLPFGSGFAYRSIPANRVASPEDIHIETSLALGGLSNVWGGNVSAVAQRDMVGWPISESDLVPYFAQLDAIVDVSGAVDDIDALYEARLSAKPHYPLGMHGGRLLADAAPHRRRLAEAGMRFGRAKIAVGPKYSVGGMGCISCGLCMHGCPHGAIFNAADVVRSLLGRPNLRYLGGRFALRFSEDRQGVTVLCRPAGGGDGEAHVFDRLFIACGVLGSTALVARSLDLCEREFVIHDSQKYYFPFLRYRRAAGALTEKVNTLAQIYIQDVGLRSTSRTVHCQLYGINDLFFESLAAKLGPAASRLIGLGKPLWERMMIGMVYFHSDDTGTLRFRVSPRAEDGLGRVEAGSAADARPVFAEFAGRLNGFASAFKGRPLGFLAQKSPLGHSLHFGGSLPMAHDPAKGQTDVLGRPSGCRRVHVVDASVLPSIPGTPTTYAVMANALRICDTVAGRAERPVVLAPA